MPLPRFTVAIWARAHRDHAHFVQISASEVGEGRPGGVFQSFEEAQAQQRMPEFQPDSPHHRFKVAPELLTDLTTLADRITYDCVDHQFTPALEASIFGTHVSRGSQEATIVWAGEFDDQIEPSRSLYTTVLTLAAA